CTSNRRQDALPSACVGGWLGLVEKPHRARFTSRCAHIRSRQRPVGRLGRHPRYSLMNVAFKRRRSVEETLNRLSTDLCSPSRSRRLRVYESVLSALNEEKYDFSST